MDPRTAWYTEEQIGPALQHWLSLCEALKSTSPAQTIDSMRDSYSNSEEEVERPDDFIPVGYQSPEKPLYSHQKRKLNYGRKGGDNKACTYGLNNSANLDILKANKFMPWLKEGKNYDDFSALMWYVISLLTFITCFT